MTRADIDDLIDGTMAVEGGVGGAAPLPFRASSSRPPAAVAGRAPPSFGGLPFHSAPPGGPYVQGPTALAAIHASAAGLGVAPPPARAELAHDRAATLGVDSALGASNAAASCEAVSPRVVPDCYRRSRGAAVEVIWVDEAGYAAPSRQHAEPSELGDEFLEPGQAIDIDHARARAVSALARGDVTSGCDLAHRHEAAIGSGDRFVALVEGELEVRFEPAQASKVLMALTAQLATVDARIRSAHDFASQPGVDIVPSLAIGHEQRLREAISHQPRETRTFIESHAERALLETRGYDKRALFGGTVLVATFIPADGSARVPLYIPESAAKDLPIMRRFALRAVVEVRCRQESAEPGPIALRALALGRIAAVASG